MNDLYKSVIIFVGFTFFIMFFFIWPYLALHNNLDSKLIALPLKNNISALKVSIDQINNISMDMKNLSRTLSNSIVLNYVQLANYFTILESVQSEESLNHTHSLNSPDFFPNYLRCINGEGSINWIKCNADIVARKTADTVLVNTVHMLSDLLKLHSKYNTNIENFAISLENIAKMSNGLLRSGNTQYFTLERCLVNYNKIGPYFQDFDKIKGCNFLNDLNEVNKRIKDTSLRLTLYSSVFKNPYSSQLWFLIGNAKQLEDFIVPPKFEAKFYSTFKEMENEVSLVEGKIQLLQTKFEELEIPFIGKFSVRLESAITVFPVAVSIVFAIFCYSFKKQLVADRTARTELNRTARTELKDHLPIILLGIYTTAICGLSLYSIFTLINSGDKPFILPETVFLDKISYTFISLIVSFILAAGIIFLLPGIFSKTLSLIKSIKR